MARRPGRGADNPRLKAAEIAYVLKYSGARLCFSEPALAPLVNGIEVITTLPALTGSGEPLPDVDPDAPAIIMYTSGTTARPKGAVHTQRTLWAGAQAAILCAPGSDQRSLATSQLAHIGALIAVYLPGLIQGASVVLLRTFEPGAALDAIERHKCTFTFALPACLQLVVEEQAEHPRDVSSLRGILASGDSLAIALQRRVAEHFNAVLLEGYVAGHQPTNVAADYNRRSGFFGSCGNQQRPPGTATRLITSATIFGLV